MPRVLLVVTSAHPVFYASGQRTGVFWAEAAHPYDVFTQAGFQVDLASETGQAFVDEHSVDDDMLHYSHSQDSWHNTQHPMHALLQSGVKHGKDVQADEYDAIYFTAGHAAMYDFPKLTALAQVAVRLFEAGKIVAAVCHGPAVFAATLNAQGDSIAKGKRVTGFAEKGEQQMGWDVKMAEDGVGSCEKIAGQVGAVWDEPVDAWADYTTEDGQLMTGVNPASAESLARKVVGRLGGVTA